MSEITNEKQNWADITEDQEIIKQTHVWSEGKTLNELGGGKTLDTLEFKETVTLTVNDTILSTLKNINTLDEKQTDELRGNKHITTDVRLTDTEGTLQLYHYVNCDDNSPPNIKESRGIIRDSSGGDKIICKTFGYTPEISTTEVDKIKSLLSGKTNYSIYYAEEGSTVRLFYYKNRWMLSTHRKIDAYKSKWGSPQAPSFGDSFMKALIWEVRNGDLKGVIECENDDDIFTRYTSTLSINRTYCFLVRNNEHNRIVCDVPSHPTLYFIGAFDNSTHLLVEGNDSGISMPNLIETEMEPDVDQLIDFVNRIDYKQKQGVIIYLNNQTQFKIMNPIYLAYFNVRGNEPSIKFRYLQIRGDKPMVTMLYNLYPECIPVFEKYEETLLNLAKKLYQSYVTRYITRQDYVTLPQQEFMIMKECHESYKLDRRNNKVSINKFIELINSKSATILNRLIKAGTRVVNKRTE